jgi:AcrR family transcriptional regulator
MRDIAAAAGVATGAAYYYFRSKEELVMAFYERTAEEAREALPAALARSKDLGARIRAVIGMKLEQFAEHRRLMVALVRVGIDPAHPLSPFGEQTAPMREESIAAFATAIEGARPAVPADVKDELPRLLWLYMMGVILYWMFDQSPRQQKTAKLLDGTLDLMVRLIGVSSLPLMRPFRKRVLDILKSVEP